MKKILLVYGLPKETVTVIIMLYGDKKMLCSPNGDTDFFDIVARKKIEPFLYIIYWDYILRMFIEL